MDIRWPFDEQGYELCDPVDRQLFLRIPDLINGTSRRATWQPFEVEIIHAWDGKPLRYSDSPFFSTDALIFRERAIAALRPMLIEHGELLPLRCNEAELRMYNVTRVLPALDEEASGVRYAEDGYTIERVRRYVFREDVIAGSDIFKLKNRPLSATFVTPRFVEAWRSAGLQGLEFVVPWRSFGTYG